MTDKQPFQDYFKAILLVDDNEATNYIHKYYLGKWGINATVYTAVDGKEAINFLKTNTEFRHQSPSLILLDINMPVMDGFEFMEQYQQLPDEHKSSMVIFMLTTSLHPSDRQRASQFKELKGYLHKPLLAICPQRLPRLNEYQPWHSYQFHER